MGLDVVRTSGRHQKGAKNNYTTSGGAAGGAASGGRGLGFGGGEEGLRGDFGKFLQEFLRRVSDN